MAEACDKLADVSSTRQAASELLAVLTAQLDDTTNPDAKAALLEVRHGVDALDNADKGLTRARDLLTRYGASI